MKPLFDPEPPMTMLHGRSVEMQKKPNIATSSRTVVRSVGGGDVVFLESDFSLVCHSNGKSRNSVVSKLTSLFESNDEIANEKERSDRALFYPEKKKTSVEKVKSLFGVGDCGVVDEQKFPALETAAKRSGAITFVDTSPLRTDKPKSDLPVIQSFYRNHKLNAGKPESFVLLVQEIDNKINLDSAITIIKFGAGIQESIGKFLANASGYSGQLTTIGLSQSAEQLIELMTSLTVEKFTGKKKTGFFSSSEYTVNDFITRYNEVDAKLNTLLPEIVQQSVSIISMMDKCEGMVDEHARLVDELDAHIIAGKIVIERTKAKVFKDHNEEFLNDQFEKRVVELMTYESLCVVSFEQVKLLQKQLLSMASLIQNAASVMYPLWRTSMSTLFARWQSSGNMKKETTISSLMSDPEFMAMVGQTENIIKTINQKG